MDILPRRDDRVLLRRLDPMDLPAFQAYRSDPEVARYQGWEAMDDARAERFLAEMREVPSLVPGRWWQIGVADPADGALMGDLGLHLSEDGTDLELGITLAPAAQGKGLGVAALRAAAALVWEATRAGRIVLITDARNGPALAMIARLGLPQVATLTEMGYPEPVFHWTRPPAR
jgi:aminoglycoside 6'-N-acetyltransferase